MPACGRNDSKASRYSWLEPGPPLGRSTLTGPEPIFLVQTLYLPPATGSMRMPATRMPGGFRPSGRPGGLSEDFSPPGDPCACVRTEPIRTDAAVARRLRRFRTPPFSRAERRPAKKAHMRPSHQEGVDGESEHDGYGIVPGSRRRSAQRLGGRTALERDAVRHGPG